MITVITVCKDALKGLKETMDSVSAQESAEFEYIVVDGDSTDGTKEFLSSCLKNCPGNVIFSYVSEKDSGIYDAMNKGVRLAKGEYVLFLNAVYRINYLGNESEVRKKIRKAKEASDFVVMVVHWGTEYSKEVDANQKKWAGIFLEEGVDLCIGSHSHVTGPVEVLKGEEGDMLTYYSLGNFFSAQDKEDTDKGMAAYVAIGTDNGEPVILSHKEYEIDIKKDGVVLKNK